MASPQKEDGYTPIANELLEQIYKLKLNGTQFKIILVIWRYTYGFSRKEHELSETFIAKATETHKKQISRELNALVKLNIIKILKEASFTSSRSICLNKNYIEWGLIDRQGTNTLPPIELEDGTGSELEVSTGSGLATQDKQYIKQILKQNIKQKEHAPKSDKKANIYYPKDELLNQTVLDFIEFRKKIKAPMTEYAVELMLKKLDRMTEADNEKIEILNQSIMNGWKGIFQISQSRVSKSNIVPSNNGHSDILKQLVEESMSETNKKNIELEENIL